MHSILIMCIHHRAGVLCEVKFPSDGGVMVDIVICGEEEVFEEFVLLHANVGLEFCCGLHYHTIIIIRTTTTTMSSSSTTTKRSTRNIIGPTNICIVACLGTRGGPTTQWGVNLGESGRGFEEGVVIIGVV